MSIVSVKDINVLLNGVPTKRKRKEIILKCDNCLKQYTTNYYQRERAFKLNHHFCSAECTNESLSHGVLKTSMEETFTNKYGEKNFPASLIGREKLNTVVKDKYGVSSVLSLKTIRDKIKETCTEKYGNETYVGSDDWKSKCDFDQMAQKAWETKLKNGSCSKSLPEERLYKILTVLYGANNVQRQVPIIKQWIDFYITTLDTYIQVDGVYWHGLNRDIEIIKQGNTSQDKKIYKQILRDEKLNNYMTDNNYKLIRITDEEINSKTDDDIFNYIKGKINANLSL